MKKIKEIKIQNFKDFQQEQVFPVNGKHVLVYAKNVSGSKHPTNYMLFLKFLGTGSGCFCG